MRNLTAFEWVAIISMVTLIVLMLLRPGVSFEQLALYIGSGLLFEIAPTIVFGFLITCTHFIIFKDPIIMHNYAANSSEMLMFEWILNGIFSSIALFISWLFLGKFAGIGFISAVSLGYYTYWLSFQ